MPGRAVWTSTRTLSRVRSISIRLIAADSSFDLVFHFRDLEQLGLVDAASGDALIRPSDRLGALYARDGQLVQAVRTPPGLYVTEARPIGFGLHRRRPSRNLLLVSFQDRAAARSGT